MLTPEWIVAYASCLSALFVAIGLLYAGKQLRQMREAESKGHDWNRRRTTHDVLRDVSTGDFPKLREEIRAIVKAPIDDDTSYTDAVCSLSSEENEELRTKLTRLLNILEWLAIVVKHKVVDEEICYDYTAFLFLKYFFWAKPYIDQRRKSSGEPSLWIDLEEICGAWQAKLDQEHSAIKEAGLSEGKVPL